MTIAGGVVALAVAVATPHRRVCADGRGEDILTGVIAFGLPLSDESASALVGALNVVLMLLPLGITPAADPAPGFLRAERSAMRGRT
ncbi:hypothetical protein [Spongiactinospora sp. 9N601]|uniref:hypothetical protein n=1 Tax=Spongiactinospora sp. 9N601 TaxID=3375149 RepID=UPI003793676E